MSVLKAPAGGADELFSACSKMSELSGLTAVSTEPAEGFRESWEGATGSEERERGWACRHGVLAAGPSSLGVSVVASLLSSTDSMLSCRESSADVESSTEFITEDSSVSGLAPRRGAGLWRVTPSSPFMVSTRRLQERPK